MMRHREYKRIVEGADVAVLFIHGIVGTPDHFAAFVPLVPENVSVYNMLLDGHGKGTRDFAKTSMKKWESQVENAVSQLLEAHSEVYIVAHSMGTLFAIEEAVKNKNVTKLFLLNSPVKIFWRLKMGEYILKVYFNRISPDDDIAEAALNCYGIEVDRNVFHYIGYIPRYLELFGKVAKTRRLLPELETPCTAYQAERDEVVARSSASYIEKNSSMTVKRLKESGHYYYPPKETEFLKEEFSKLFV